jgi:hypothetical protein
MMQQNEEAPNSSNMREPNSEKTNLLYQEMKEIAEGINSKMAFVIYKNSRGMWQIPEGGAYSEEQPFSEIAFSKQDEIIERALSASTTPIILDNFLESERPESKIPDPLKQMGIDSLIAAFIQPKNGLGFLFVCNSKRHRVRTNFPLSYELSDVKRAQFYAKQIERRRELRYSDLEPFKYYEKDPWTYEKPELLKTHPSWYVAYQDGKRVALSPTLNELMAGINKKFGVPHKPCELHEIVDKPALHTRQSPRLMPTR